MNKTPHKRTAKHKAKRNKNTTTVEIPIKHLAIDDPCNEDKDELPIGVAGQHFHMDFEFVRGSSYSIKQEDQPTVTSIDGYNSYIIAVDRIIRYKWIFLTSSKAPPITIAKTLLEKLKCNIPHRTVRTDQGGELGLSHEFQNMLGEAGFALEITGTDTSAQNSIAESPNKYLASMMRCLLHAADLGPEYWSLALCHAVYIKKQTSAQLH